jgi:hypothetical protein
MDGGDNKAMKDGRNGKACEHAQQNTPGNAFRLLKQDRVCISATTSLDVKPTHFSNVSVTQRFEKNYRNVI